MRQPWFLIILLLTVVMVASGCQRNPATGRLQYIVLPASQVNAMGAAAKPDLIKEYGGEVPSTALRNYVDQVGRGLLPHVEPEFADLDWSFTVLDSDVINAFALPGGNVFISRGLMSHFDNEAQLAAVLGHEIGHISGKHVDERISQAVTAEVGLMAIGSLTESDLALLSAQIFATGYTLRFGRGQELEADSLGVRYMTAAGYDPEGMVQVLEVLAAAAGGAAPPEILSTHPNPQRRIRDMRRHIDEQYAHTRDNPEYDLRRSRYQNQAKPHLPAPRPMAEAAPMGCWCPGCQQVAMADQ